MHLGQLPRHPSFTEMATRAALCLAPILSASLSLGKIYRALVGQAEASDASWGGRAEQQPTFLPATSTSLSRTSGFSPDGVKAPADSGSSNVDSGHPAGTQPDGHPQLPAPVPAEAASRVVGAPLRPRRMLRPRPVCPIVLPAPVCSGLARAPPPPVDPLPYTNPAARPHSTCQRPSDDLSPHAPPGRPSASGPRPRFLVKSFDVTDGLPPGEARAPR